MRFIRVTLDVWSPGIQAHQVRYGYRWEEIDLVLYIVATYRDGDHAIGNLTYDYFPTLEGLLERFPEAEESVEWALHHQQPPPHVEEESWETSSDSDDPQH
jgi:hypothetical protein